MARKKKKIQLRKKHGGHEKRVFNYFREEENYHYKSRVRQVLQQQGEGLEKWMSEA